MLSFKKPEISDKQWVNACLKHANSMNCEYTFGNLFIWSEAYKTEICKYKDFLIVRWHDGESLTYSVPLGEGDFTDAVEKMASLSGKKYHSKRNHITFFKKTNPDWQFEPLTKDNIDECIALHAKWIENKDSDNEDYSFEFEAVLRAFEYFNELDFVGGLIRVNGEAVAFTMGEGQVNSSCFVTHFEKAPAEMRGAYPIICQEFTKNCLLGKYEYVNREEDLGIEGLRKAKQSYYPEIFLKKGVAVYND